MTQFRGGISLRLLGWRSSSDEEGSEAAGLATYSMTVSGFAIVIEYDGSMLEW